MLDLAQVEGYASEMSLRPGEELELHLSSSRTVDVEVEVVRLGVVQPPVTTTGVTVEPQHTNYGNWFEASVPSGWANNEDGIVLWAFIMPTRPDRDKQVVIGGWDDASGGLALAVSEGHAELWVGGDSGQYRLRALKGVRPWAWYLLVGVVAGGELRLYQRPVVNPYNQRLAPYLDWDEAGATHLAPASPGRIDPGPLRIGAGRDSGFPAHLYDGKVDLCGVFHGPVDESDIDELMATGTLADRPAIAAWDPALGITDEGVGDLLMDRGVGEYHARGVNKPTRLVTGRLWAGRDDCFALDKAQYSAVSFASDAMTDCGWERTLGVSIPSFTESGVYAARLSVGDRVVDEIPFVVRPEAPRHKALLVLPTLTYIAESNDRNTQLKLAVDTPITTSFEPRDGYGGSTGDLHPDGSGVCFVTRRRPMQNLRSDVRSGATLGPGNFAIDLELLRFLHHTELDFDVVTDEDIHRDGVELLSKYRTVVTGSRPIYVTVQMLTALDRYVGGGGRLVCFGGGGFYWVTSLDPDDSALLEVRRGETGLRSWQAGPGELYHATSGERGGLWRGRGRPPQKLLGAGHSARGFGPGTAFKRMPDSYHKAVSWIFEGVTEEVFGVQSLLPGGAASLEIDRYDRTLGSPPNARILATSLRLSDDYHQAIEETLFTLAGRGGQENEHVRADMVFFEAPNGGAVFAAGSAGWCAAMAVNGFDNPVATLSANVLRGMMSAKVPGGRFDDEDDLESQAGSRGGLQTLISAMRQR